MATNTTIVIGGDTFKVSLLDYETTCDLLPLLAPVVADVARLVAVLVGAAVDMQGGAVELAEVDVAQLVANLDVGAFAKSPALAEASAIVADIADALPAERLRHLRRTLLQGCTMNGQPLYATVPGQPDLIGQMLRGRTVDGLRLLGFALGVNYPDFFGLFGRAKSLAQQVPSATS